MWLQQDPRDRWVGHNIQLNWNNSKHELPGGMRAHTQAHKQRQASSGQYRGEGSNDRQAEGSTGEKEATTGKQRAAQGRWKQQQASSGQHRGGGSNDRQAEGSTGEAEATTGK